MRNDIEALTQKPEKSDVELFFERLGLNHQVIELHNAHSSITQEGQIQTLGQWFNFIINERLNSDSHSPLISESLGSPGTGKTTTNKAIAQYIEDLNKTLPPDEQIHLFFISGDEHEDRVNQLLKEVKNIQDIDLSFGSKMARSLHFLTLLDAAHRKKGLINYGEIDRYLSATNEARLPSHSALLEFQHWSIRFEIAEKLKLMKPRTMVIIDRVGMSDSISPSGEPIIGRNYRTEDLAIALKNKEFPFENIQDPQLFVTCSLRGVSCHIYDFARDIQQKASLEENQIVAFYLGIKPPQTEEELRERSKGASWEHIMFAIFNQHRVLNELNDTLIETATADQIEKFNQIKAQFPDHFEVPFSLIPTDESTNLTDLEHDIVVLHNLQSPLIYEDPLEWESRYLAEKQEFLKKQGFDKFRKRYKRKTDKTRILRDFLQQYNVNLLSRIKTSTINQEIRTAGRIVRFWKFDKNRPTNQMVFLKGLGLSLLSKSLLQKKPADATAFILSTPTLGVVDETTLQVIEDEIGYTLQLLQRRFQEMVAAYNNRPDITI